MYMNEYIMAIFSSKLLPITLTKPLHKTIDLVDHLYQQLMHAFVSKHICNLSKKRKVDAYVSSSTTRYEHHHQFHIKPHITKNATPFDKCKLTRSKSSKL